MQWHIHRCFLLKLVRNFLRSLCCVTSQWIKNNLLKKIRNISIYYQRRFYKVEMNMLENVKKQQLHSVSLGNYGSKFSEPCPTSNSCSCYSFAKDYSDFIFRVIFMSNHCHLPFLNWLLVLCRLFLKKIKRHEWHKLSISCQWIFESMNLSSELHLSAEVAHTRTNPRYLHLHLSGSGRSNWQLRYVSWLIAPVLSYIQVA